MRIGDYEVYRADSSTVNVDKIGISKKTGEPTQTTMWYARSWESALLRLFDLQVQGKDIKTFLKEVQDAQKTIISAIKANF